MAAEVCAGHGIGGKKYERGGNAFFPLRKSNEARTAIQVVMQDRYVDATRRVSVLFGSTTDSEGNAPGGFSIEMARHSVFFFFFCAHNAKTY